MSLTPDEILYPLLPSFYRQSDLSSGEPLRALLAVLERELRLVDANISRSYENWFIETCEDWVVPYIAELLGVRQLPTLGSTGFNHRTYVANILSYRRRKGTASVISQYGRDVTGWPVRLVEYFRLVADCQNLRLPSRLGTIDLRNRADLRRLGSPFDAAAHTVEVRNIRSHGGRYNLPSVGLFAWRLRSYRMSQSSAGIVDEGSGRFTFDPLGRDVPLFNPDRTRVGTEPQEADVPAALTRAVLAEDLHGLRRTPPLDLRYFGDDPVFTVLYNENPDPVPADKILITDLGSWNAPFDEDKFSIAIDPQLGRLLFAPAVLTDDPGVTHVKVTYHYGFSSDVGGGPYDRRDLQAIAPAVLFPVCASIPGEANLGTVVETAIDYWVDHPLNPMVVEIQDSEQYDFPELIEIPAGMQLVIRAANLQRPALKLAASTAPVLVTGSPTDFPEDSGVKYLGDAATLTLDGLLVDRGILRIYAKNNNRLSLRHCTLRPYPSASTNLLHRSVHVVQPGTGFTLDVKRSITGPLGLPKQDSVLTLTDSIVDGTNMAALTPIIDADSVSVERCTIIGRTEVNLLPLASDSIFTEVMNVKRTQPGCMRFCYVPSCEPTGSPTDFSATPPRYRCQPDGALVDVEDDETRQKIRTHVVPIFTSKVCGQPGYAQLGVSCSEQIRRGGSDESEMGVFFELHQPQREANLKAGLAEFLRIGYEAGIFFIN